jgi:hypothetical protein
MKNTVDISLGTAPEIYQLFSYANPSLALTDVISHTRTRSSDSPVEGSEEGAGPTFHATAAFAPRET